MPYLSTITFLQIVTESLPVSSSGNCMLWIYLLELYTNIKTVSLSVDVDFLMHGPTILVVALCFLPTLAWYLLHRASKADIIMRFVLACCITDLITVFGYIAFRKLHLLTIPLWFGFFITACLLLSLPLCKKIGSKKNITYSDAVIIGLVQACALLPGISRFGSTYVAAYWLGYSASTAFGYSFAIHLPLLCAAFAKGCWAVTQEPTILNLFSTQLLVVTFLATVLSYFLLKYMAHLAEQNRLYLFGFYVLFTAGLAYVYAL